MSSHLGGRRFLRVEEAAGTADQSDSRLREARRWIVSGGHEGLPAIRLGRSIRIPTGRGAGPLSPIRTRGPLRDAAPPGGTAGRDRRRGQVGVSVVGRAGAAGARRPGVDGDTRYHVRLGAVAGRRARLGEGRRWRTRWPGFEGRLVELVAGRFEPEASSSRTVGRRSARARTDNHDVGRRLRFSDSRGRLDKRAAVLLEPGSARRAKRDSANSPRDLQTSARGRGGLMLRVTTLYASSAVATAAYYTRYLAQAPGEEPGVWSGRQADGLGLAGRVEADDLQRLLEGRDPRTGTPLGMPLVDRTTADGSVVRAVAGFDATFSAPKSRERVVGADRRPGSARRPRPGRRRGVGASGAVRGDDPGPGGRPPSASGRGRVVGGDVPADDVAGR